MKDKRVEAEALAKRFHDMYEQLAPVFYYETKKDTRIFNKNNPNGKLMIEVCFNLLREGISNQTS